MNILILFLLLVPALLLIGLIIKDIETNEYKSNKNINKYEEYLVYQQIMTKSSVRGLNRIFSKTKKENKND